MCFGGSTSSGPSQAELDAAAQQRAEATVVQQDAAQETAKIKREDIGNALTARVERQGKRGGTGRRSLFSSSKGAAGYLGRFD